MQQAFVQSERPGEDSPASAFSELETRSDVLTFLVVDDYGAFRRILRQMVESHLRWCVLAEASDGQEAVQLAMARRPQVVLMDVVMPVLNGIEAARRIKQSLPETRVILFSSHHEEEFQRKSLQAGVDYFLWKEELDEARLERIVQSQ